ncbi:MAG: hypothetical protein R2751_12005 [Bacteroidales bacterium]
MSGPAYLYEEGLRERWDAGRVIDVGFDQGLNYERLVALNPDVVFPYGWKGM